MSASHAVFLVARHYLSAVQGREIFVSKGLGDNFGTFWRAPSGSLHRVKSPAMPMVATQEKARNLDAYAAKNRLKPVDGKDGGAE